MLQYFVVLFLIIGVTKAQIGCEECACQVAAINGGVADPAIPGCFTVSGETRCGQCRLSLAYYQNCGAINALPADTLDAAWKRCAGNLECSKTCVHEFFVKYRGACQRQGMPLCQILIRNHMGNLGALGCQSPATVPFFRQATALGCAA